jgi:hypothetical protein
MQTENISKLITMVIVPKEQSFNIDIDIVAITSGIKDIPENNV